jgi:hypothetical protein
MSYVPLYQNSSLFYMNYVLIEARKRGAEILLPFCRYTFCYVA